MPATVASTAISTGVVTVVATPTWFSAAMMPSARMKTATRSPRTRPYERPPSAPVTRSRTALAIAAATTTMTIATNARGSQATTPRIRSLIALGPHTPKANCRVNSRTA